MPRESELTGWVVATLTHCILAACGSTAGLAVTVDLLPEGRLGEGVSDDLTTTDVQNDTRCSAWEICLPRMFTAQIWSKRADGHITGTIV